MVNRFTIGIFRNLLCSILVFVLLSCDNDKNQVYEGYGMVDKKSDTQFSVWLDDGKVIYPREGYVDASRLRDSMRVRSIFTILEEHVSSAEVDMLAVDTILTKDILPYDESILDSVGNAPVRITNAWIAHGFLNFEFIFVGDEKRHMVNLLQRPAENGKLLFEFRHNDFGDRREKTSMSVVSFRLHNMFTEASKPMQLIVEYKDSDYTSDVVLLDYK